MGEMIGMDPEVVRGLAVKLDAEASSLRGTLGVLDGIVHHLSQTWSGPGAEEFIGSWHQQHRPALSAAVDALGDLATSARNNARQQDVASDGQPDPSAPWHAGLSAFGLGAALVAHEIKGDYSRVVEKLDDEKHEIGRDLHVLANNPDFQDAVKWSGRIGVVTSLVTPFVAGIPIVGEAAMAINFDVNAFHFAGEALEMDEGAKPVDVKQLAFDGVGTVFAFTDVAGVTAIAPSMAKDVLGEAPTGIKLGDDVTKIPDFMSQNFVNTATFSELAAGVPQDVSKAAQAAKLAFGAVQAGSAVNDLANQLTSGQGNQAAGTALTLDVTAAAETGYSL